MRLDQWVDNCLDRGLVVDAEIWSAPRRTQNRTAWTGVWMRRAKGRGCGTVGEYGFSGGGGAGDGGGIRGGGGISLVRANRYGVGYGDHDGDGYGGGPPSGHGVTVMAGMFGNGVGLSYFLFGGSRAEINEHYVDSA